MNFAQKVYFLRSKHGLSQAELGKRANISQQSIAGYERGRTIPPKNTLIQLAKVLGVEPEDLTDEARSVS